MPVWMGENRGKLDPQHLLEASFELPRHLDRFPLEENGCDERRVRPAEISCEHRPHHRESVVPRLGSRENEIVGTLPDGAAKSPRDSVGIGALE
jgi:hypothetical protein